MPAVVAAHGGRYLVRGGATDVLEGEPRTARKVILQFPDMTHRKAFYHSPEYTALFEVRQRASTGRLVAVEGV